MRAIQYLTPMIIAIHVATRIISSLLSQITKDQMQQYANIQFDSNYCMLHEQIPAEYLPVLYYVGDGPYMVLATKKSQN